VIFLRSVYDEILGKLDAVLDGSAQAIITYPPIIQLALEIQEVDFLSGHHKALKLLDYIWKECIRVLTQNGILWMVCDNYFYDGQLVRIPFSLAQRLQSQGLYLRNIIIWYNREREQFSRGLVNRYSCILMFSKGSKYKFYLDRVREPHIWKDVEWGGGRPSRYNPLGKDPSNVWLKTQSEKGRTLKHIILSYEEVIERCLLCSTDENDIVLNLFEDSLAKSVIKKLGRKFISCSSTVNYDHEIPPVRESYRTSEDQQCSTEHFASAIYVKSSEKMDEIPDSSVQVIITSPPYWGLRDYGVKGQIGYDESYEMYLDRLNRVWKECYRVLKPTGSLWININKRFIQGNLILFPEDICKKMSEVGFYLKDIIIWYKPVYVPTTGPRNFSDRHEYVLFFTKSKQDYLFMPDKLKQQDYLHEGGEMPSNVWKIFRKIGNIGRQVRIMIKERNIEHTAIFPEELVKRISLLCSKPNDVVLDPFAGSGTTVVVANKLGRQWIGYELNPEYKEIIKWRLANEGQSLLPWSFRVSSF